MCTANPLFSVFFSFFFVPRSPCCTVNLSTQHGRRAGLPRLRAPMRGLARWSTRGTRREIILLYRYRYQYGTHGPHTGRMQFDQYSFRYGTTERVYPKNFDQSNLRCLDGVCCVTANFQKLKVRYNEFGILFWPN